MYRAVVILLFVSLVFSAAYATVPRELNYQGVLTDTDGGVVPDGSYSLTFRIYDVETGGSALWEETQDVTVSKGTFSVVLGSVTPLNLSFDKKYYLGVSVAGGDELTPRMPIAAAAYSISADRVVGPGNIFPSSGRVGIGTISPTVPLHVISADQVGIKFQGSNSSYASIYVDGTSSNVRVGYGYLRNGVLKAYTFVSENNDYRIRIGGVDRIFVDTVGRLGDGVASPVEMLDVAGGIRLSTTGNANPGTIRWTGTDFEGYDGTSWKSLTSAGGETLPEGSSGMTLRHDGLSWVPDLMLYNDGTRIGIGTIEPEATLHVGGSVMVGSDFEDGSIEVMKERFSNAFISIKPGLHGGYMATYDDGGHLKCYVGSDAWSDYGKLIVMRDTTYAAFRVYSEWGSTGEPYLGLLGTERSVVFALYNSDDNSVYLPQNAVSSSEILDEVGLAAGSQSLSVQLSNTEYTTVAAQTIVAPAYWGCIFATITGEVEVYHSNGSESSAVFGLSNDSAYLSSMHQRVISLPADLPTGVYEYPVTITRLFSANEGDNTIYFIGQANGSSNVYFENLNMTLMYIPTSYGSIYLAGNKGVPEASGEVPSRGLTSADIARIRDASLRANEERLSRELAEIRARIEELERSIRER